MKKMAIAELKAHFSEVLEEVRSGETIGVLYGRARTPVAMIVPYREPESWRRPIGMLDGSIKLEFMDDFDMTEEGLLGSE